MASGFEPQSLYCEVCEVKYASKYRYERHLQTSKHKSLYQIVGESSTSPSLVSEPPGLEIGSEVESPTSYEEASNKDSFMDFSHVSEDLFEEQGHNSSTSDNEFDEDEDRVWGTLCNIQSTSEDYWPFPTKEFALLYILAHSPNPVGEANFRFIWYLVKQLKSDVPSLFAIKQFTPPSTHSPVKHYSQSGVPFYTVQPSFTLEKCIGSPSIAKVLRTYPEIPSDLINEMWQGKKWLEDSLYQAPTAEWNGGLLFVCDFINFVHPLQPSLGEMMGKICQFYTKETHEGVYVMLNILPTVRQFSTLHPDRTFLCYDYEAVVIDDQLEIQLNSVVSTSNPPTQILSWDAQTSTLHLLNLIDHSNYIQQSPMKEKCLGLPVKMVPLLLYTDDTSGNRSKKWNKFDCWCFLLAGLPRHQNSQLHNIHFIGCSNRVDCMEMSNAIVADLKKLEEGVVMYDAGVKKDVLVVAPVLGILADNPRHSEVVNHLGSSANLFCRMCMVDRHKDPTKREAERTKELAKGQMQQIRALTQEKAKVNARKMFGMREDPNPFFDLQFDLLRSTPVEVLHTVLLGPYKYLLKSLVARLSTSQKREVLAKMSSFNYSGFSGKVLGNIITNHKSFVGRDYKAWAQMALFIVGKYLTDGEKKIWLGLSKIFRICYCVPLRVGVVQHYFDVCEQFLSDVKEHHSEMLKKQKIHLLLHLPSSMECFGPTSAYNTERCESFNSRMRGHNIYSNKASSSRDIASSFESLETLWFLCDGGRTRNSARIAGEGLLQLYTSAPVQRFLLGVQAKQDKTIFTPGVLRKKQKELKRMCEVNFKLLDETVDVDIRALQQDYHLQLMVAPPFGISDHLVMIYTAVVARDSTLVNSGHFVKLQLASLVQYGLFLVGLLSVETHANTCLVYLLQTVEVDNQQVLNEWDCPLLMLSNTVTSVSPSDIMTEVSVIHECDNSCSVRGDGCVEIERETIVANHFMFRHDWTNKLFCLNLYCMSQ